MKTATSQARTWFFALLTCTFGTVLFCTPKPLVLKPLITTVQVLEIDSTEALTADKLEEKIAQYEMMLEQSDAAVFTHEKLMAKLFDLYIHEQNPEPPYQKAIVLADSLLKMGKLANKRQYVLNWKNILEIYLETCSTKDSLEKVIGQISDETKNTRLSTRKQTKVIDSLTAVINAQKSTIEKLQELDLRLEQQRSKIP